MHFRSYILATVPTMREYTGGRSEEGRVLLCGSPRRVLSEQQDMSACSEETSLASKASEKLTSAEELLLPGVKLRRSDVSELVPAAKSLDGTDSVLPTFVASYVTLVQKALYAGEEPSQKDAHATQICLQVVKNLVDIKRKRAAGAKGAGAGTAGTRADAASPHAHFASPPAALPGRMLEGRV